MGDDISKIEAASVRGADLSLEATLARDGATVLVMTCHHGAEPLVFDGLMMPLTPAMSEPGMKTSVFNVPLAVPWSNGVSFLSCGQD